MADRQAKDVEWDVVNENGKVPTWEHASIAVLMDIRRELRTLNRLLGCANFNAIPHVLRNIEKNTKSRKRKPTVRP